MEIQSYKCPNCGGGLVFDPKTQKFKCEYCLSAFTEETLKEMEEAARKSEEASKPGEMPEAEKIESQKQAESKMVLYTCPSCGGRGHIDVDLSFLFGAGTFQSVCPECGGSGKVVADPCPDCGGSGRTRVTSEQTIEFPAGTHDSDEVRISGMGHAGTNGAAGGDLVGRAHVEAERLEGKARTGFYLMGIVAPFLVLSAISGVFSAFAVMCFIPFTMGLFMVLSDGVLHRSLLWWKRGAMQFANGFANGFMFALVSVWFASCSQRAMLSPYQMQ